MSLPENVKKDIDESGYYPELTAMLIEQSLFGEKVLTHILHMETHMDLEAIHRHVTVLVVTPTRLLLTHVDDEMEISPGAPPRGVTATDSVALNKVGNVLMTRLYADPANYTPGERPVEVAIALSWGNMRRLEIFPESCADPSCENDHGFGGTVANDDLTLRISQDAEGAAAVAQAEDFGLILRELVFHATTRS